MKCYILREVRSKSSEPSTIQIVNILELWEPTGWLHNKWCTRISRMGQSASFRRAICPSFSLEVFVLITVLKNLKICSDFSLVQHEYCEEINLHLVMVSSVELELTKLWKEPVTWSFMYHFFIQTNLPTFFIIFFSLELPFYSCFSLKTAMCLNKKTSSIAVSFCRMTTWNKFKEQILLIKGI